MPEIRPTIGSNGCTIGRDNAGHIMITAPVGTNAPTPTIKARTEH